MSDAWLDWSRAARTGVGEALFCQGKSSAQIAAILDAAQAREQPMLLTRLNRGRARRLGETFTLDYDPTSRTAYLGRTVQPAPTPEIAIVTAGTSDLPVAREAGRTLEFHGHLADCIADCGVAGLWRLWEAAERLRQARVIIAVAGMEGALFSALAGLVPGLVIAVPSAVGYGVAQGGHVALQAALAACAPGVVTVNIGNGFGAACAALKVIRSSGGPGQPADLV